MYSYRLTALAYTGLNGNDIKNFLAGVAGLTWKILTENTTQLVIEGTGENVMTEQYTVPAGHYLTVQATSSGLTAAGPWSPGEFDAAFAVITDPATVPALADVAALATRVEALERVLAYPLSVEARLS